jgi:membrane-associated protease RseP (regulator of RpoE activity)
VTPAVLAPSELDDDQPVEHEPVRQSRTETILRLGALVAGITIFTALLASTAGWQWVVVVWSVIVIVMLHELGHFATAKWSGMKATEFFVGFGPRLWSIRRGETEYGFKALPLGGYVKILGMTSLEELDPSDEPRSFVNQSTSKRVLVASAGSIVHFLLAFFLAVGALWFIGLAHVGHRQEVTQLTVLQKGSTPAQLAGLRLGDQFVSIDGVPATSASIRSAIEGSRGHPVTMVVLRHGHDVTLVASPRRIFGGKQYYLGIDFAPTVTYVPKGFFAAVTGSGSLMWSVTSQTFGVFGHAFSPSGLSSLAHQVTNSKAGAQAAASNNQAVSLPYALVLAVDALKAGTLPFIGILISLNISLGILNMLPMLPLDGGHVAIALYERVRTRRGKKRYRADVTKLMPVAYAFMGFLLLFVAGKMYLNFSHGVANPFG